MASFCRVGVFFCADEACVDPEDRGESGRA